MLTKANIRTGPGKEFDVDTTLLLLQEIIIIKNDTAQWKEVVEPVKGYIFHELIGTEGQDHKKYIEYVEELIPMLKDMGVIIKADGNSLFVNQHYWIDLGTQTTWEFVKHYALALRMKNNMEHTVCYVYDYQTGRKILYYNTEYDTFKRY